MLQESFLYQFWVCNGIAHMSFTRSGIIEAWMDVNKAVVREENLVKIDDKR
jgi:hypothetical protein